VSRGQGDPVIGVLGVTQGKAVYCYFCALWAGSEAASGWGRPNAAGNGPLLSKKCWAGSRMGTSGGQATYLLQPLEAHNC